jgi:hypothetical protein
MRELSFWEIARIGFREFSTSITYCRITRVGIKSFWIVTAISIQGIWVTSADVLSGGFT